MLPLTQKVIVHVKNKSKKKKIRGSAWTEADDTFIFTPYLSMPDGEKNMVKVCAGRYFQKNVTMSTCQRIDFHFSKKTPAAGECLLLWVGGGPC